MMRPRTAGRWAFVLCLAASAGCGEDEPTVGPAVGPTVGGDCDYREVRGVVRVVSFSASDRGYEASVELSAQGSPHAAQAPGLYRPQMVQFPCAQCADQLGVTLGSVVPTTARVNVGHGGCTPWTLSPWPPWPMDRCDCDAPLPSLELRRIVLREHQPTLPLDPSGRSPDVPPPWSTTLTPPDPIVGDTHVFDDVRVADGPWRCDLTVHATQGRATSVSGRCEGGGAPVEVSGGCGRLPSETLGRLVLTPPSTGTYLIDLGCAAPGATR